MSLVHNEQVKLYAGALNTAAISCFTVGVVAPMAAAFYNLGSQPVSLRAIVIGVVIWLGAAIAIHFGARRVLKGLR